MYLIAFATDYDGTLAHRGRVDAATVDALERLRDSGRKLLMVTGRELPDLKRVFDRLDLFDLVVAENGALLYFPETQQERLVGTEPPADLVAALQARGVAPLSVGRGIVATWEPHERTVLECIRELGLEWQIIFNKGAVMVLPPGVNKATGLSAGLMELGLSPLNVAAIGDAENDHAFLTACGCSIAVANALEAVKKTADLVTQGDHGAGVIEAIDAILSDDSKPMAVAARRRRITLGEDDDAGLTVDGGAVLIAGSSGIGKSTLATAIVEKLTEHGFQICVIDPEGDYDDLEDAVVLGDARNQPAGSEVTDFLQRPDAPPLVVNMLGFELRDRPEFFREVVSRISNLRGQFARPHWLVIDEAHHMLPCASDAAAATLPAGLAATIYVTVHPDQMAREALEGVRTVIGVGPQAGDVLRSFCKTTGIDAPAIPEGDGREALLFWQRDGASAPHWLKPARPRQGHKRHTRKYAEGELVEIKSFYFRGPGGNLNLRAQNLMLFLQLADGVDDAAWLFHLNRGDYTRWFRDAIKDDGLADEAENLQDAHDPARTRAQMREMVERRYTAPAKGWSLVRLPWGFARRSLMTISMYQASVPRLANLLENLSRILDKAQAHVDAGKTDVPTLMDYRLAPDMYPFSKQVQIACDKARSVVARLAGMDVPFYEDDEKTLAELKVRITRTVDFIRSVPADRIDGTEDNEIVLPVTGKETRYTGMQLLLGHSMPNVYFHATTAYNILRQNGVPIGKRDFLGNP